MALTFTLAGLETELDAVATALAASDLPTARTKLANAALVCLRLPDAVIGEGQRLVYSRRIETLTSMLSEESAAGLLRERRRIIRARVAHK